MSTSDPVTRTRVAHTLPTVKPSFGPPPLTWAAIEEELTTVSGAPERVAWEVAALRTEVAGQTTSLFLRRLFSLAWALIDEAPATAAQIEEGGMT